MVAVLSRRFTQTEAREVAGWNYPAPFDIYNVDPNDPQLFLMRTAAGEGYYPAVDDCGEIVAFCVLGAEARVMGQQPQPGTLDIGLGVRPDLTSHGLGSELLTPVRTLVASVGIPELLRTAVASFNTRSLALCRKAGFATTRQFTGPGERTFQELSLRPQRPETVL